MLNIAPAGGTFDAEKKYARRIDKHIVLDTCVLHREVLGRAVAVLALVSAFAADMLLRGTFDSVLKRLERKAEKTKDAGNGKKQRALGRSSMSHHGKSASRRTIDWVKAEQSSAQRVSKLGLRALPPPDVPHLTADDTGPIGVEFNIPASESSDQPTPIATPGSRDHST